MEVLLAVLGFVIPAIIVMVVARRFLQVMERLRDPEGTGRRLKLEIEHALVRAGVDPNSFKLDDPNALQDLPPEITKVVQRALLRSMFAGDESPASGPSLTPPPAVSMDAMMGSLRPRPIGEPSRSRASLTIALLLLGFIAGIALMLR